RESSSRSSTRHVDSTSWRKCGRRRCRDAPAVRRTTMRRSGRSARCPPEGGHYVRIVVVVVSVCGATLHPSQRVLGAQLSPPPKSQAAPAPKSQTAAPARAPPADGGWPRDYVTTGGGAIRVFQPQVASWDGQRRMVAFAAVSYTGKGASSPALGTVRMEAETSVALDDRLVSFTRIKLTESHFASLPKDELREVVETIERAVPPESMIIGLDRGLARLAKSQLIPRTVVGLTPGPPVIMYSTPPAILVNVDGDVVWSPIKENDLRFAVNTNWDLFEHEPTKTFYLRRDQSWLAASDVNGPWKPAGKLPGSFAKLPADDNWKDVKA